MANDVAQCGFCGRRYGVSVCSGCVKKMKAKYGESWHL